MTTESIIAPVAAEPKVWAPGWYPGLPMADYLAIDAASNSSLKELRQKSPSHYRYAKDHPRDVTRAMDLGTAVHLALLEPDLFDGRYVVLGQCSARKKGDGKPCENAGVMLVGGESLCGVHGKGESPDRGIEVLPESDMAAVIGARDKILAHPRASSFYRAKGEREVTGLWTDPATGLLCKMRLDVRLEDPWILPDLKSTPDASEGFFKRHLVRQGYHRKLAWYRRGSRALGDDVLECAIIAAEVTPPYEAAVYLFQREQMDRLEREDDRHLYRLARCKAENAWPGYSPEFIPVELPDYEFDRNEGHESTNGGSNDVGP